MRSIFVKAAAFTFSFSKYSPKIKEILKYSDIFKMESDLEELPDVSYLFSLEEAPADTQPSTEESSNRRRLKKRKIPFKWNKDRDNALILEVESVKPFLESGTAGWKAVTKTINEKFMGEVDYISVQRHFKLLLKEFKKEDFKNRYKSGTEEEVTDIQVKLGDLASLIEDHEKEEKIVAEAKSKAQNEEKLAGDAVRGAALETLKRTSDAAEVDKAPPQKRVTEKSVIELYQEKLESERLERNQRIERELRQQELEQKLRQDELELSKRKLELEEKKLELEVKKHADEIALQHQKLEIEKNERMATLKTQEVLLTLLASRMKTDAS